MPPDGEVGADDPTLVSGAPLFGDLPTGAPDQPWPETPQTRRVLGMDEPGRHHQLPFTRAAPIAPTPPIERLIDWVYAWRTWLVLGLAGIITASVAGAYLGGAGNNVETVARRAAAPSVLVQTTVGATSSTLGAGGQQPEPTAAGIVADPEPSTTPSSASPTTTEQTTTNPPSSSETTLSEATTTTESGVGSSTTDTSTEETTTTEEETTTTEAPTTTTTSEPAPESSTTPETKPTPGPKRVEAETGELLGTATIRDDHKGFSGTGFVGDIFTRGSGLSLTVESQADGPTPFTVGYSAGPVDGGPRKRMLTVFVNDDRVIRADMQLTESWSHWDVVVGELPLREGTNKITLRWAEGDTGWVNLDYIEIG